MNSLEQLCIQQVSDSKSSKLKDKLNKSCYEKFVNYQMMKGFPVWKEKAKLLEVEMNIEDMEVAKFKRAPFYFIFIKFKKGLEEEEDMDDEEDFEDEYELFRNEIDSSMYNVYFEIAKKRGLIEMEDY